MVEEIEASGGNAIAIQADITDMVSIQDLIEKVLGNYQSLQILVNAVHGQFNPRSVSDMIWEDWEIHLNAIKGHFLLCKAVLPIMRSQHYGRIVYISGGLSRRYFSGCSAYTTVKAGLNGFCKTLAIEEGFNGITVNIVAPGKVIPGDGGSSTDKPEEWDALNQQSMANIPLGRYASGEDVANAVVYFASPQAAGITGQTLYVAGGEIMP